MSEPTPVDVRTRRTILLLSLAAFSSAASLRVTDAMLPRIAHDFDIDLASAANSITAFAVAYGLLQAVYGPVGDRFGKVRVVAWASLGLMLTSVACAFAPTSLMLTLTRACAGATAAAIIPLSMAWIGDTVPYAQRQSTLARFLLGQIVGFASGQLVGGASAEHVSWRLPFWLLAGWSAVVGVALLGAARAWHDHGAHRTTPREPPWREMRAVLSVPWARVVLGTVFLEGVFLFGPFAYVASHLHARFGLPLSQAGLTLMVFAAGGAVFALGAAWFVRTLGESGLAMTGGLLLCAALVLIGASPVAWTAAPAAGLAGLGYYMWHNTMQTHATQMAPERRGAAVAAFASAFFIGQSIGVAVLGRLAQATSLGTLVIVCGCVLPVIAGRFARRLVRRRLALKTA